MNRSTTFSAFKEVIKVSIAYHYRGNAVQAIALFRLRMNGKDSMNVMMPT